MAKSFPRDRFDDVPRTSRVGAHRAPAPRGRGWAAFGWAALATAILVALGILGLSLASDRLNLDQVFEMPAETSASPTPTETTTPTAEPTIDPKALVQVLNGTTTPGLAGDGKDKLAAAGWTDSNITASNASDTSITTSTVYYDDPTLEGAARGVAESLGISTVTYSTEFSSGEGGISQIVVVLGSDFAP
ncbi:LytR cell envelope-related transcriptional attenuator [Paramicrobacterium humi]|uniref:LytR cell envelope-related transcriptional attenuator n=1 Tax=Paramicrobacterium humi TaxID=640635 RepID=A0A1H4NSC1_9MICO|nr:LytR C-terminal domain-containing protein [Microbacterium humi]SEB98123.1 LytR cell envelope-related transcriptional attenuator [Microbacterium humi]